MTSLLTGTLGLRAACRGSGRRPWEGRRRGPGAENAMTLLEALSAAVHLSGDWRAPVLILCDPVRERYLAVPADWEGDLSGWTVIALDRAALEKVAALESTPSEYEAYAAWLLERVWRAH